MANNRTITYQVNFKSNDAALKSSMNQLFQTFDKLSDIKVGVDDGSIKQAVSSAQLLEDALFKSFNMDTHKLDMSKFNKELQTSGKNLEELSRDLISMGPQGQQAFQQLAQAVAQADAPIKKTSKLMDDLWFTMQNTMKWKISSSVLDSFTNGLKEAVNYTKDLDKSLNDIRIVTGQSAAQMEAFAQKANKAAKELSSSTLDYTNAALIYYQQGLNDKEVKERTDATIKMANVTGDSAKEVSSYMTAVWNNFDNGTKSLEYYADAMTALGAATASSTDEIATGLEKFAGIADTVGLSYEYATSALATLVAETRQSPETVGTALKTIFSRLQGLQLGETLEDGTTLNKYSKALATIGVDIKGQGDSLKSMDQILDEIGAKWQGLAKDQKMALAQTVGGVRQYTQLITLMDNYGDFQQNIDIAKSGEGTLNEQSFLYEQGWQAATERVKASMEGLYQELLNDDFFKDILNFAADFVDGFTKAVDAVGGLAPILTLLSTIIINKMAPNISQFFSNTISNLSVILGKESERSSLARQTMMDLLQEENLRLGISTATKQQNAAMGDLLSTQESLYQNSKYLSAEQKDWAKGQIDQLGKLSNLINQYSADVSTAGAKINVAKRDAMQSGLGSNANQVFNNFKNINTIQRDLAGQTNQIMNGSISPEQAMGLGGQELDDFYGKVENFNKTTISSFVKAKTSFNEFKKGLAGKAIPPELQERVNALDSRFSTLTKNIRNTSVSIKQNKNDAQGLSNAYGNLRDNTVEADAIMDEFNNVFKETTVNMNSTGDGSTRLRNSLDQLEQGFNEEAVATDKANQALEMHKKKASEVRAQIDEWSNGLSATIQKISGFASSAMSVLMGIQSFKTLFDENATASEKWMAALMGVTMIAPTLVKVIGLLSQLPNLRKKQQAAETAADSAEVKAETEKQGLIRLEMGKTQQAVEGINNEKREGLILLDQESGKVTTLTKQYQALNAAKRGEIVPVDVTTTPGYAELPPPNNAMVPATNTVVPSKRKHLNQLGAGTPRDKSKFIEGYAYETMDDGSRRYYTSNGNFSLNRTVGGKSGKYGVRPKGTPAPKPVLTAPAPEPVPEPTPNVGVSTGVGKRTGKGAGKGLGKAGGALAAVAVGIAAGYLVGEAVKAASNYKDYAKEYDDAIASHADAQARTQMWQEELTKAQENLGKLNTYISEVEKAEDVFEGLTKGTAAWDAKLIEANNATKDLLKSFGMLSSKNYTKDKDGVIRLTENAKKEIEEKQKQQQMEAQEGLLVSQNAAAVTEQRKKMAAAQNSIANMNDSMDWAMFGTAAGGGAAIGAAIGSIIPGIGTAVGAALGGVAGLITGAVTTFTAANQASDTKVGEEFERLSKILNQTGKSYEEYMNSGGQISEGLEKLLGDANASYDSLTTEQQKLRDALAANTEALNQLFLALEANTEEQAYNNLIAAGYSYEEADKASKIGVNKLTLDTEAEIQRLKDEGWGTKGVSKATKTNEKAEEVAQEYLTAAGIKGATLTDTTGTDKNRKFVFSLEGGGELVKSLDEMIEVTAAYNASEAAQKAANRTVEMVQVANSLSGTQGEVAQGLVEYMANNNTTDNMTVGQIQAFRNMSDEERKELYKAMGLESKQDWIDAGFTSQSAGENSFNTRINLPKGAEKLGFINEDLKNSKDITQGAINQMNKAFNQLDFGPIKNGSNVLKGFLHNAFEGLDPNQLSEAFNIVFDGSIDWSMPEAPGELALKLKELGIDLDTTGAEWEDFVLQMQRAANYIPDFTGVISQLTEALNALKDIKFGDLIDKEVYDQLIASNGEFAKYFLAAPGEQYKFVGDPNELTNALEENSINQINQARETQDTVNNLKDQGVIDRANEEYTITGQSGQQGGLLNSGTLSNSSEYSSADYINMLAEALRKDANGNYLSPAGQGVADVITAAQYDPNQVASWDSDSTNDVLRMDELRDALYNILQDSYSTYEFEKYATTTDSVSNVIKSGQASELKNEAVQNELLDKAKDSPELYEEVLNYIQAINSGYEEQAKLIAENIEALEQQKEAEEKIVSFREQSKDSYKTISDPNASVTERQAAYTNLANDINSRFELPQNISGETLVENWNTAQQLFTNPNLNNGEMNQIVTALSNAEIQKNIDELSEAWGPFAEAKILDYLKSLNIEFENLSDGTKTASERFDEFSKLTGDFNPATDSFSTYQENLAKIVGEAGAAQYLLEHFGDKVPKSLKTKWELEIVKTEVDNGSSNSGIDWSIDEEGNKYYFATDSQVLKNYGITDYEAVQTQTPTQYQKTGGITLRPFSTTKNVTDSNTIALLDAATGAKNGEYVKGADKYYQIVRSENGLAQYIPLEETATSNKTLTQYRFSEETFNKAKGVTAEDDEKARETFSFDINVNGLNDRTSTSSINELEKAKSKELLQAEADLAWATHSLETWEAALNAATTDDKALEALEQRVKWRNNEITALQNLIKLEEIEKRNNEKKLWNFDGESWAHTLLGYNEAGKALYLDEILQNEGVELQQYLNDYVLGIDSEGKAIHFDFSDGLTKGEIASFQAFMADFNNDILPAKIAAGDAGATKYDLIDLVLNYFNDTMTEIGEQQTKIDEDDILLAGKNKQLGKENLELWERGKAKLRRAIELENKKSDRFLKYTEDLDYAEYGEKRIQERIKQAENAQTDFNIAKEKYEFILSQVALGLMDEEEAHKANMEMIEAENKVLEAQKQIYEELSKAIDDFKSKLGDLSSKGDEYIGMLDSFSSMLENLSEENDKLAIDLGKASINLMNQNLVNIRAEIESYKTIRKELEDALVMAKMQGNKQAIAQLEEELDKVAEDELNAQSKLLSELSSTLDKIVEVYEQNVDRILEKWSEAAAGIATNLETLEDSFTKEKELSEQYLDTETQLYELEKMRRTINKELAGNQNLVANRKLQDVLEDINKIQAEGLQMSEYDLKMLQAKYDLRKAEIELEEAQNNKTEVRLMRNAQGNWSYVFTANQDAITDAEQKVADEREKISNESEQYLQQVQENLIKMEKERQAAIGEAFKEYRDDEAALEKETKRINAYYSKQYNYYGSEMNKVLGVLGLNFEDTSYAILTGYSSWDEAQQDFANNGKDAVSELKGAYAEYENQIATTFESAGMEYETFTQDLINKYVPDITTAMEGIVDEIEEKTKASLETIKKMIEEIEIEIEALGGKKSIGYANADYNGIVENPEAFGGSGWVAVGKEGPGSVNVASNGNLVPSDNNTSVVVNGEALPPGMVATTGWLKSAAQAATGMYTGEWGPEGKLAVLHEKELVLNKADTKNILSAVEIMRQLINSANYSRLSLGNRYYVPTAQGIPTKEKLEQNVHVEASFPGVQSALEIETALNNIVNDVSQYIQKK